MLMLVLKGIIHPKINVLIHTVKSYFIFIFVHLITSMLPLKAPAVDEIIKH